MTKPSDPSARRAHVQRWASCTLLVACLLGGSDGRSGAAIVALPISEGLRPSRPGEPQAAPGSRVRRTQLADGTQRFLVLRGELRVAKWLFGAGRAFETDPQGRVSPVPWPRGLLPWPTMRLDPESGRALRPSDEQDLGSFRARIRADLARSELAIEPPAIAAAWALFAWELGALSDRDFIASITGYEQAWWLRETLRELALGRAGAGAEARSWLRRLGVPEGFTRQELLAMHGQEARPWPQGLGRAPVAAWLANPGRPQAAVALDALAKRGWTRLELERRGPGRAADQALSADPKRRAQREKRWAARPALKLLARLELLRDTRDILAAGRIAASSAEELGRQDPKRFEGLGRRSRRALIRHLHAPRVSAAVRVRAVLPALEALLGQHLAHRDRARLDHPERVLNAVLADLRTRAWTHVPAGADLFAR